jgi:predicted dehydrogenase
VIAAADHGKHALVEKPMATNVADCDAMIAACEKAGVTLSVIQTLRYRGVFLRAKELIDEGRIGRVLMTQLTSLWTWYHQTKLWLDEPESGGSFLDRGAHICDALRWLTGDEPSRVFGWVGSTKGEAWKAMSAMIQIQFAGGASAQSWMSHELPEPGFPDTRYLARIYGEKGIIEADGFAKLRVADSGAWEDVWEMPEIDPINRPNDPDRLEAFYLQTQDFISSLREGREPAVKASDGRAAIEMVQAAYLSSLSGAAVQLPLPRQEQGFQFDGPTVARERIPG